MLRVCILIEEGAARPNPFTVSGALHYDFCDTWGTNGGHGGICSALTLWVRFLFDEQGARLKWVSPFLISALVKFGPGGGSRKAGLHAASKGVDPSEVG